MSKILFVFGCRPEAIKVAPVVAELRELGIEPDILCTGQHTDLLKGSPAETDLANCENLKLPSLSNVSHWMAAALWRLVSYLHENQPSVVVVQGDTMSAVASAHAANDLKIPLAHIEAGVRSHSMSPWPEEQNRVEIAELSNYHYAPTITARDNLLVEQIPVESIQLTGNTAVSALARYTEARPTSHPCPDILITFHRREVQITNAAEQIVGAVLASAKVRPGLRFLWPMHPGFKKWLPTHMLEELQEQVNIDLLKPMAYTDFAETLANSLGVLTDSGGVVEEAATLGVPSVVARPSNDRPEAEAAGVSTLLPPTYDGILEGINILSCRELKRKPLNIYGTPEAAAKIALHLAEIVK